MTLFYITRSADIRKKPEYEGRLWFPKAEQIVTRPWESLLCRNSFRAFVIRERGNFSINVSECNATFILWMRVFHAATYNRGIMFQYIHAYRNKLMESIDMGELLADSAPSPGVVLKYLRGEYSEQLARDILSCFHRN